ncbi:hypothetical protein P8452_72173 [Trifolium repens]|nr:hypothetical protein P8452_72173 [Trifolium repens]
MAELQKSLASFRRQGSSGLVWDDKFLSGLNQNQLEEQQQSTGSSTATTLERSRSAGAKPYRSVNVAPPSRDPPSPKVATCGFCGLFGKPVAAANKHNPKSRKRR